MIELVAELLVVDKAKDALDLRNEGDPFIPL
jgi:hypothetical protein